MKIREIKRNLLKPVRKGMAKHMIGPWDWIIAPALLSILAIFVMAAPIKIWGLVLPEPIFPLVLAFSWPLIRPSYVAPFVLALLGLFCDMFWGAPFGLYTFLLLCVYGFFLSVRSYIIGQETLVVAGIFSLTCLAFCLLGTIFVSIGAGEIPRLFGVFEQVIATSMCFPIVNYMLETYLHADVRFQ